VPPRAGLGPGEKNFLGLPDRGGIAKNLYTVQERLTLSCRVTWAWSERFHLYSRQIMILLRNTKTYVTYLTLFLNRCVNGNLYRLPLPSLVGTGSILSNVKSYHLRNNVLTEVQLVGKVWQQFWY